MKKLDVSKIKRNRAKSARLAKRLFLIVIVAILIFAIIAVGAYFYIKNSGKKDLITDLDQTNYQAIIEYKGNKYAYNEDMVTVAFFGVDKRDINVNDDDFSGANDTNVIAGINLETGEVKMLAIPRDSLVEVDVFKNGKFVKTEEHQLEVAYAYGSDGGKLSCENAVNCVSRILQNIPIQKYFVMDMEGINNVNDSIGGVILKSKIDMPEFQVKKDQIVTLKGDMAETYLRRRSMTDLNASIDRTERQVQYLESFSKQVFPAAMVNNSSVLNLYQNALKYSQTNINVNNVTYLATKIASYENNANVSVRTLKGEMSAIEDKGEDGAVNAVYHLDEDDIMDAVIDMYYLRVR